MLPRVLLLDLDDTILDDTGGSAASWERACLEEGAPESLRGAIRAAGARFWSDPDRHRAGRADLAAARRAIVTAALDDLGLHDPALATRVAARHDVLRDEAIAPLPGAFEALRAFRAAGTLLGLITNGSARHQRWKLARFDLEAWFAYIGIEGEVGVGKPEPEAFERALTALEVAADDAWMAGDSLRFDVGGAQAVGLHAIWVDVHGTGVPEDVPVLPDRIVRGIADLLVP